MSDKTLWEKSKEFFGFGAVDTYEDSYYRDRFEEQPEEAAPGARTRHRDTHLSAREERDGRDSYGRGEGADGRYGRYDREYEREGGESRYRGYTAGATTSHQYGNPERFEAARTPGGHAVPGDYGHNGADEDHETRVTRLKLSSYQQAPDIADEVRKNNVVVFNLRGMEKNDATRVLDFAAGVMKALDADLKKLNGPRNFALIPRGVELDQDQIDQLGGSN